MYLSRIALNNRLRKTRQAIAFPQMMHAAVLGSFPPALPEASGDGRARVLWRIDPMGEQLWLYVASEARPDFRHIVEQFGWPGSEQEWESKVYDGLLGRLESGQKWRFRLHANPVHTVQGKIYPHITVAQQIQWLKDRSLKNGFSLDVIEIGDERHDAVDIVYRNTIQFKKQPSDRTRVTLAVATFEGLLIVDDADTLRKTLCFGIGRAKAYGCGLLTLAGVT